ncbi:DUF371 domain-containing protein [Halovivax limisalsi]|uniref:DUF371 domain-containing protein n=1 Tax=Halovivax limisalsi TaxID=1453760 RepID=UPI001FFCF6C1|nr:DUF371 domain-containing protein [Halovivax limisalsi]
MSDPADAASDGRATETIRARGHEHVTARHASTLEITTDDFLTPAGDCILAIEADRAPADFDPAFVAAARDEGATITVTVAAGGHETTITGRGDPRLSFESDRSAVCRTSDYVDDRTILVEADAAAADLDRALVDALADGAAARASVAVER